jgi:hypothetical protein
MVISRLASPMAGKRNPSLVRTQNMRTIFVALNPNPVECEGGGKLPN